MNKIKNLIFDFGGVIVDIDRENAIKKFESIGVKQANELLDKYHQRGIFLEVENGQMDADMFCHALSKICHKNISFEEAQKGWLGFMVSVPPQRLELLNELKEDYNIYILSNTNPFIMDWARSERFTSAKKPLDYYVHKIYTSYEVKFVKPQREFFDYVITDIKSSPEECIFIDDGKENIKVAKELGFNTFLAINDSNWITDFRKFLTLFYTES